MKIRITINIIRKLGDRKIGKSENPFFILFLSWAEDSGNRNFITISRRKKSVLQRRHWGIRKRDRQSLCQIVNLICRSRAARVRFIDISNTFTIQIQLTDYIIDVIQVSTYSSILYLQINVIGNFMDFFAISNIANQLLFTCLSFSIVNLHYSIQ